MTVAATISPATPTCRQTATVTITGLTASTNYLVVICDPVGGHEGVQPSLLTSDGTGTITVTNYTPTACGTGSIQVFNAAATATFGPTTATVVNQL